MSYELRLSLIHASLREIWDIHFHKEIFLDINS